MYLEHFSHLSMNFNQVIEFFFFFKCTLWLFWFRTRSIKQKNHGAYQLGDPIDFWKCDGYHVGCNTMTKQYYTKINF
jgi:hypothetical protein